MSEQNGMASSQTTGGSSTSTATTSTGASASINTATTGTQMSTGQRTAPPAPPASQATTAVTAMPPKVSVHLAPYNGVSSVVQWWMNFISYIQLYQMTNDQALNILPFYFTEPVKHWFYQLQLTTRASLTNFKQAFFARYRKTEEDLDLDEIKQGIDEDLDSYIFRFQQAASDLTITEAELTKKAVKGLRQALRGHVYMRKPKTMEDLRQEARLVERGISMSNPMGEDVTATIQASVNAAMASMQQLMTPVAAVEPNPSNRVPHRPPQQKQQQPMNLQDSRGERKRVCFGCARRERERDNFDRDRGWKMNNHVTVVNQSDLAIKYLNSVFGANQKGCTF